MGAKGAVRLGDIAKADQDAHGCPACPHPVVGPAVSGSPDVNVNKLPAIRLGDPGIHMACCGPNNWKTAQGSPTVYVNKKPLVRLHDQTSHCGGVGKMVQASGNVFIDTGLGSKSGKDGKDPADGEAGNEQDGKNGDKAKGKDGSWTHKTGKGKDKNGKGKGKDGKDKDGKGGKDKDHDHSKDAETEAEKEHGGIVKAQLLAKASPPGEKVGFEISVVASCKGEIKVEVLEKTASGEKSVTKTSVTADGKKKVLKGSFKAPTLGEKEKQKVIHLTATHAGKKPVESGECVVTAAGVVLVLFEERSGSGDPDPQGTEPTGQRSGTTVRLTKAALEADGLTGPVQAKVTLKGNSPQTVTFNDDGIALIAPSAVKKLPDDKPSSGAAYEETEVKVEIVAPAEMKKEFKVKAFAPAGG